MIGLNLNIGLSLTKDNHVFLVDVSQSNNFNNLSTLKHVTTPKQMQSSFPSFVWAHSVFSVFSFPVNPCFPVQYVSWLYLDVIVSQLSAAAPLTCFH